MDQEAPGTHQPHSQVNPHVIGYRNNGRGDVYYHENDEGKICPQGLRRKICLTPTTARNKLSQTKRKIFRYQVQHRHILASLTIFYLQSARKAHGFASAWDFWNLDLPHFRILVAAKKTSTCSKKLTEHDSDGKIYFKIIGKSYFIVHTSIRWDLSQWWVILIIFTLCNLRLSVRWGEVINIKDNYFMTCSWRH